MSSLSCWCAADVNMHRAIRAGRRSRSNNGPPSATFANLDTLRSMRRTAIAVISLLPLLLTAAASAAGGRHVAPAKCAPSSHVLLSDGQAQGYVVDHRSLEYVDLRGCVYGQRRSFLVAGCGTHESAEVCADSLHVTLVGSVVATEEAFVTAAIGVENGIEEWHVVVRNLRTGRVLHEVPTGTPLNPPARYIGVGNVVALVL